MGTLHSDIPIRTRIWQLAILACCALVVIIPVLAWTLARTHAANLRIKHTEQVRGEMAAYVRELIDAETGQRGYLLTHQDVYLEPFRRVVSDNEEHFARLTASVRNPTAMRLLPRLGEIFHGKLTELGETIQLVKAGDQERALAIVMEGSGRRYTVEFQRISMQISAAENQQLESQQTQAEVETRRVLWVAGIGCMLSLIVILFAAQKTVARIDGPLKDLIEGLDALARGDLTQRVHTRSHDEIGKAAAAFNDMADRLVAANRGREHSESVLRQHHDHLEEMVALATAEVNAIVQTAVSGIITIDVHGMINVFNPAAERLFGWRRQEAVGKNVAMLMAESNALQHDRHLSRFAQTGQSRIIGIEREVTARRKDGSTFPAQLAIGHTELSASKHLFVGFITDISEQKAAQDRLQRAKDAAEAGARAKATFIANMSHEIRTPMNAIIGFAEVVLQDSELSRRNSEHIRIVLGSAKALLGIINDILDVTKLESGRFALERVAFHLPNALADALMLMNQQASAKGLTIVVEYHADLPLRFTGDPTRLRQVVLNLVGNAIKFTEKGGINVSVKAADQLNMLHFCVADTGIGMTPAQVTTVFDSFSQADSTTTRRFGGTGLGTTISKQIVELMGGEIWVESAESKGSTFHFTAHLPAATVLEGCIYEEGSAVIDGYISPRLFKVLLVEDIEANATLATLRLKQQGHQVQWRQNGQEAVCIYQTEPFDLILMDVMMPVMDGLEATRAIRKLEAPNGGHIPIIALTASIMREDNEKCIAAGMDGVLAKPIDFDGLLSAMEHVVEAGRGQPNAVHRIEIGVSTGGVNFSSLDGIIDHRAAIRTWHDPSIYAKALASFAVQRCNDADKMERLLVASPDNVDEAREIAHALKGLAGNLFITKVAEQAIKIDADLKAKRRKAAIAEVGLLRWLLSEATTAIGKIVLAGTDAQAVVHEFDANVVVKLFGALSSALATLNPDGIEPIMAQLGEYLPKSDLAPIQTAVDAFDFDAANARSAALCAALALPLE